MRLLLRLLRLSVFGVQNHFCKTVDARYKFRRFEKTNSKNSGFKLKTSIIYVTLVSQIKPKTVESNVGVKRFIETNKQLLRQSLNGLLNIICNTKNTKNCGK